MPAALKKPLVLNPSQVDLLKYLGFAIALLPLLLFSSLGVGGQLFGYASILLDVLLGLLFVAPLFKPALLRKAGQIDLLACVGMLIVLVPFLYFASFGPGRFIASVLVDVVVGVPVALVLWVATQATRQFNHRALRLACKTLLVLCELSLVVAVLTAPFSTSWSLNRADITIQVLDKETQQPILNAQVEIQNDPDDDVSLTTSSAGIASGSCLIGVKCEYSIAFAYVTRSPLGCQVSASGYKNETTQISWPVRYRLFDRSSPQTVSSEMRQLVRLERVKEPSR